MQERKRKYEEMNSVMSIDVNHFAKKEKSLVCIAYGGHPNRSP